MPALIPIALVGWIFFTLILFNREEPQKAIIISLLGSFFFLPSGPSVEIPILPSISKFTAVSYGIAIAELTRGLKQRHPLKLEAIDAPMVVAFLVSPFATALANDLGVKHAIYNVLENYVSFAAFFWAGRRYFGSPESLRLLTKALSIGGLILVPLILFEIRMGPTLCYRVYGFIPHSFIQHIRYGGYRPMLFMQHGLMVALWIAASAVTAFWHWKTKLEKKVWRFGIVVVTLTLAVSVVLCKSANGVLYLAGGIASYFFYKSGKTTKPIGALFALFPLYFILRLSNIITTDEIEAQATKFFDVDRVGSLVVRLEQEVLFGMKGMQRPFFGWGLMGRAWPVDESGNQLVQMVDSMWIILFSIGGFTNLAAFYLSIGLAPWHILCRSGAPKRASAVMTEGTKLNAIILSIIVFFYLVDCLLNAMPTPVYPLIAGALTSYYVKTKSESRPVSSGPPEEGKNIQNAGKAQ